MITGASSGIGEALAYEMASRGANLVLGARNLDALTKLSAQLQNEYHIVAIPLACDVSRESDCEGLIEAALNTFKGIDVLINNAGISMKALFKDLDLKVLKHLMDVNFWGTVYCSKYALPALLDSRGILVGVSSIAGFRGLPGRTGYSASKFAMHGFLESLRTENLKTGLHVMLACPGFTASNIRNTALNESGQQQGRSSMEEGKMMSPQEVAEIIVKGILARKRTLVMTRQGKLAVWMNKIVPAWVDKQVFKLFAREKDALVK